MSDFYLRQIQGPCAGPSVRIDSGLTPDPDSLQSNTTVDAYSVNLGCDTSASGVNPAFKHVEAR